jgi:ADP-heptose:LPS heptosyltransferase
MRLLRPLGIRGEEREIHLRTEPGEEARVEQLLRAEGGAADDGPLVCVHVGSGLNFYDIALKRWPTESFAEVASALVERHNATIVFTGTGAEERDLVRQVREGMKGASIDLVDQLSVGELLALLRRTNFTLCNDTSVMHLSAAVGTPVAAIFGPTSPLHYGPNHEGSLVFYRDLHCSPCLTNYNLKVSYCSNPVCVRGIGPAEVLAGIERAFLEPAAPQQAETG